MVLEIIKSNEKVLAILVNTKNMNEGLKFISPEDFPMQVGIHNKNKGVYIEAHKHYPKRMSEEIPSQEVFYIERGKALIDIYEGNTKFAERILTEGDLIILNSGHGVTFLEDTKLIEIKQGPYTCKEDDKVFIK
jgi:hypothetical protein